MSLGNDVVRPPAFIDDAEIQAPKRRAIEREHILQKHVRLFVRDAIDGAEFFAFDRSAARGKFTHMREQGRGVRKGTPDTLLRVRGVVPVWCELKAPGNKPDPAQIEIGRRLQAVGDVWFWATTVEQYREGLASAGVPMRANAAVVAQHHDACVSGVIGKAEQARGKAPKSYRAGPRSVAGKGFARRARSAGVLF